MLLFEWLVPLLLGAVALTLLAQRLGAPYPAFLALGGAALALLPSGPNFVLDPDLALALFVAPVLLDTAYDTSFRDIRNNWFPIISLVLAAVGLSTLVVAVAARLMLPGLPWAAAIALGAIVAPPDATAAIAIFRQVRLPFRIATILQGESLLNDASALFIYRLAVTAVGVGAMRPGFLVTSLVLVLPASLAAGWLISRVTTRIVARIEDVPASIIVQFGTTFGIWMLAERLQLSAVLTMVSYAAAIAARPQRRLAARMRVPAFAVWETVTFTLNVLAFVMIGLQLRPILEGMQADKLRFSIGFSLVILVVAVLARLGWSLGYQLVRKRIKVQLGRFGRNDGHREASASDDILASGRSTVMGGLVVGWSGMRGIVTLAAAFALPESFPHRDLMLLAAFTVVLGTLVFQGLTLKAVVRWADLDDDDPVGREIGHARTEVFRAALGALDGADGAEAEALRSEFSGRLHEAETLPDGFVPARTPADELRLKTIEAGRDRLVELRARGIIGGDAYARIEEELDQAEMNAS